MGERIRVAVADKFFYGVPSFFPFTEFLCSGISDEASKEFRSINLAIGEFELRVAQEIDAPMIYDILRSYGTSPENYGDLEIIQEEKIDIMVRNVASCLIHKRFITFFLLENKNPIAFFQIDPYNIKTIEKNLQKKLSDEWDLCFDQALDLKKLSNLLPEDRLAFLNSRFISEKFNEIYNREGLIDFSRWTEFIAGSISTYAFFAKRLNKDSWVGNISYNVIPKFQHQGLMSMMIEKIIEIISKIQPDCYIFSDRIAIENKHSVALMRKMGFIPCGSFLAYYGSQYKSRNHKNGNFCESCIGFFKKIT